ncbi:MAG: hypothetical protein IPM95_13745 [Sphingobacteriales bacterium]|nr:hypothetical protein [Sphingobacteriales bacterium]
MTEYITDIDTFYSAKYLYKMKESTGEMEWSHAIENIEAVLAIELEDGVLLQEYNLNGDGLTIPAYRNVFENECVRERLYGHPYCLDTIILDSIVYFSKEMAMPNEIKLR